MTFRRNSLVVLFAIASLAAGRATAALNCACGTCAAGEMPAEPCCGEAPVEPEPCACAHLESPDGVPAPADVATSVATLEFAIPEVSIPESFDEIVSVPPRGPGPPRTRDPLYLRDLDLRL